MNQMRLTSSIAFVFFACMLALAAEPPVVLLWPSGAPGSEGKTGAETVRVQPSGEHAIGNVHQPSITVYLPTKESATGASVLIAPGGGHSLLSIDHEGHNVARWLQDHGVAGLVLKYRLAREKESTYTIEGTSLSDTQRAVKLIKSRASEWAIDPARIGVIGFSAGGEADNADASGVDGPLRRAALDELDGAPGIG